MISTMSNNTNDAANDFIEKKVKLVRNMNMSNNFNHTNAINNVSNNGAAGNAGNSQDDNSNSSSGSQSSMLSGNYTSGSGGGSGGGGGGRREFDAADTLVSLANSATNTPTVEYKPFTISPTFNHASSSNSQVHSAVPSFPSSTGVTNNIEIVSL
jgi:hypothetical protein